MKYWRVMFYGKDKRIAVAYVSAPLGWHQQRIERSLRAEKELSISGPVLADEVTELPSGGVVLVDFKEMKK